MLICALTVVVGCLYAEAAAEALEGRRKWRHILRETGLALTYWLMAFVKYLDVLQYTATLKVA